MRDSFPFYRQMDSMDCGPTCILMISEYYGKLYSLESLREKSFMTREGVSMLGISQAAEAIGFRTLSSMIPFENLKNDVPLPAIAHWRQNHFVVVYKVTKTHVYVADPAYGKVRYSHEDFRQHWISTRNNNVDTGLILFLEPSPAFYEGDGDKEAVSSIGYFFRYLKPYRKYLAQVAIGMLAGSGITFILPFLSQSIIDIGIFNSNFAFINLILLSQLILNVTSVAIDYIRSWIFLHIGTRISIAILSDFLRKLLKMPFDFFDNKTTGDLMQRIGDHKRIQSFLTSSSLGFAFSIFNIFIFGLILLYYDVDIFVVYAIGSAVYMFWVIFFLKRRRDLDYKNFAESAASQTNIIQLIAGVQEIKLQNCERKKRWEWENVQARLFKVSIKALALNQYQHAGSFMIDKVKNIFISYFSAKAVIEGDMTLGMMLSVSYIVGQLNSPIAYLLELILSYQDAQISMDRLNEINSKHEEEEDGNAVFNIPEGKDIVLKDVSFQYAGPNAPKVLDSINLTIPHGRKTAIVGASGSGKTTLMKLILKIYNPSSGEISLGNIGFNGLSSRSWREVCGVVAQDGYLFSDTIANNIAISDDYVNRDKLANAVVTANIQDFVESLPLKYNTRIGPDGNGISQGQRQRLMIARAVYKNPSYIFLDEATNSLDSRNEKIIVDNLEKFFVNKTVLIIAHRLSTVKNCDNIIVLNKGTISESGTHEELINLRGEYFTLIQEQLSLGE